MSDAAVAAIKYVLKNQGDSPIEFLHAWTYGNFDYHARRFPTTNHG